MVSPFTLMGKPDIYNSSANVEKSPYYKAMQHRAPNVLTAVDKKAHGMRRRILSQGLSDSSTRAFGNTIKKHIERLCQEIEGHSDPNTQWSESYDMARWCEFRPRFLCVYKIY
ncbi:unnamed protein product [Fusarium graminearum]|nr:unnamed protein product [Fusarium graminearum]VTO83920.1 unnamed protein product [Fusarium graminearum]